MSNRYATDPLQTKTINAAADIAHSRFAGYDSGYKQCGAGAMAIGVTPYITGAIDNGENGSVIIAGIATVLVGSGGVTINGEVASDANGKAVAASSGDIVNGIALNTASADGYVSIKIVTYEKG